jgi:two-component system cell cycle sensor histidine kinase/response regulator CckA
MSPNHPARRKMDAIGQAAEQAASLTGQLLAFGKHQAGVPGVINFNPVVRGMDAVLQSIAGESVEFEARLTDPLGNVEIDASELEHLILNFVTNACDAMPSGGHLLLLETSDVVMEQPYTDGRARLDRGRYVELAVTDTGVGIDPGMQAHIFEPFFSTKSDGRRGAGLGLAASYATVMQSGGAIVFKSTPEKGSRFSVYLPVVDKPTSPEVVVAATKTSSLDATVMVVEDNDSLRTLVTEILEGKGCRVQAAAGPLEALEQLGKKMPDLILTDVIMPVMNGPEMVDKMLARAPELKILYMSGYTSDALEGRASIRHQDILQKPFSPVQLVRKVTDALG